MCRRLGQRPFLCVHHDHPQGERGQVESLLVSAPKPVCWHLPELLAQLSPMQGGSTQHKAWH